MSTRIILPSTVIIIWCLTAILAGITPIDADIIRLEKILMPPQNSAWLGYDALGRSIGERLILGTQTSFLVATYVVSITSIFGTCIGIIAAWCGGIIDKIIIFIIDVFLAFPGILLAIALSSLMGPGITNAVIALSIVGWVGFARLARAQTLTIKHRNHVLAAKILGTGTVRIGIKHILPLIMAPLIIEATFAVSATIIAEASLSFLGLGVQPPDPSWGSMIRDGTRFMLVAPHTVLAPSITIFLVVLSINSLGDTVRDKLDIKTR